ncbi:thioesterase family protein [Nocardioides sp. zg-1228]|uniref:acyl-CoA thioesterase n=1 Tax=Nocardioides sp. zg-1228 TaxID=2763008 RepID=UPI0016424FF9|nr:thioesterase family protein [Nocardioides sp. zg-1228]MBC2933182.1 acyl-CoA thioesterase [Nocardioides sp. zg-1228]QSF56642.1 acyl-CoA thioesterase [Nocardioides sp. zg-1228]
MRHLYRCPLRWADLDLLGHVNNVTYVDYLQEARVDMFRTHAPASRADDLAEGVVVVRHEVTYLSSLTFGSEPVSIECWVTEIRAASFTMAYEVFEEDASGERTVYVRARTVLTPYVFSTERPRRLHAEERESLGRLLEPDEPVRTPRLPDVVDVPGGRYSVHVRFSDVDVYGHVNNVKYFEYFQEARIQLMMASGAELGQGHHLVVAQVDVDYRRPILFRPEPYDCRTWISRIGTTSVVFDSVVRDGEEVLARARVVGVCMDSATGRPAPVPDVLRDLAGELSPGS